MTGTLFILLQIFCLGTTTWAAFKDFVIENEKDLKRYGPANDYDEDFEYQLLNDEFYEDNALNALGSSCGGYPDTEPAYDIFRSLVEEENVDGLPAYQGHIDKTILKEIMRQLANDPRFQHLTEDKLLLSFNIGNHQDEIESQKYVDYYEEDENFL